jgi:hypothetical protein
MIINIALLIILIGSVVTILFIFFKKLHLVAVVDINSIQQQQMDKKKELVIQKLEREIKLWLGRIKLWLIKATSFLVSIFKKTSKGNLIF